MGHLSERKEKKEKKTGEKDAAQVEKRRRQNRESQRRYRERHRPKTSREAALYEATSRNLGYSSPPLWPSLATPSSAIPMVMPESYNSAFDSATTPYLDAQLLAQANAVPAAWSSEYLFSQPPDPEIREGLDYHVCGPPSASPALSAVSAMPASVYGSFGGEDPTENPRYSAVSSPGYAASIGCARGDTPESHSDQRRFSYSSASLGIVAAPGPPGAQTSQWQGQFDRCIENTDLITASLAGNYEVAGFVPMSTATDSAVSLASTAPDVNPYYLH